MLRKLLLLTLLVSYCTTENVMIHSHVLGVEQRGPSLKHEDSMILIQKDEQISLSRSSTNNKPIIGILTQPSHYKGYKNTNYSYIATSYKLYLEKLGAIVRPIHYDDTQENLENIFQKIDGLVFPGGNVKFTNVKNDQTDKIGRVSAERAFIDSATFLLQLAKNSEKPFPVWGTCLGFQLILFIESGEDQRILSKGFADDSPHSLFEIDMSKGSIFEGMDALREGMENGNRMIFNHNDGVKPSYLSLTGNSSIESINFSSKSQANKDDPDSIFFSSFNHKNYPIYGVQFHPEKVEFEKKVNGGQDDLSIHIADAIGDSFIRRARMNMKQQSNSHLKNYFKYGKLKSFPNSVFESVFIFHNKKNNNIQYGKLNKHKKRSSEVFLQMSGPQRFVEE